ncbi:MAG TPA: hypothetical protein VG652_07935 [Gaiellaceae bacterium]|nr:hypothetical protein [Gaiellaceae bacterium]
MSSVTIDGATGSLLIGGNRMFPIVLSNPPPSGGTAPNGKNALAEIASAGVSFIRTGIADWSASQIDQQIAAEQANLAQAQAHGLLCWLWLGGLTNLPVAAGSPNEQLLTKIVAALGGHPALGAYKGIDEPANPPPSSRIPVAALTRAHTKLKALDASHPLVIIQAPTGTVADLTPYRPAFDITGADIYPVSYPPGIHGDGANHDISVVGDTTKKMVAAAGGKPVWMTLQIAWSGSAPSQSKPETVPRFPTLHQERFMAYQAIVNGARGLNFFGGHLTQVTKPVDAAAGWNWTFWELVLRPLLTELTSTAVAPALVAANATAAVKTSASDVELVVRQDGSFLYVIAVRRSATTTSVVNFTGLPPRHDGQPIGGGQALFEYVQDPPPPPIQAGEQTFRNVDVASGGFGDWFGPHDSRVYRFPLSG